MRDTTIQSGDRSEIINYIQQKKYTAVVDVGGSVGGWSKDVVQCIVDIQPASFDSSVKIFKCNITVDEEWEEVEKYVEEHGKFDFSICTHTLEDINNPLLVCQKLEKISNAGYIAVPSKYRELSYIESPTYRGHIHHRWIFDFVDGVFTGFPKLSFLERDPRSDTVASTDDTIKDLHFIWEDSIDLRIINGDYMGPSIQHVLGYYDPLFIRSP